MEPQPSPSADPPAPDLVPDAGVSSRKRRLPLVLRIPLLLVGLAVAAFGGIVVFGVFLELLHWNDWAASWIAIVAGILLATICLIPFAWARQPRAAPRPDHPAPLPVRVLVTVSGSVLPLAATITLGAWLYQVPRWPDPAIVVVTVVALTVLYGVAIGAIGFIVTPADPEPGQTGPTPGPAIGPRPGDPLLPEDVFQVTVRPVVTLVREGEHAGQPPDQSVRDGSWFLQFDLGEDRWVHCLVVDGGAGGDQELIDADREANEDGNQAVPIRGLGDEAYAFTDREDQSVYVWAQLGARWIIQTRASDHYRRDTLQRLAQATVDRLRRDDRT